MASSAYSAVKLLHYFWYEQQSKIFMSVIFTLSSCHKVVFVVLLGDIIKTKQLNITNTHCTGYGNLTVNWNIVAALLYVYCIFVVILTARKFTTCKSIIITFHYISDHIPFHSLKNLSFLILNKIKYATASNCFTIAKRRKMSKLSMNRINNNQL